MLVVPRYDRWLTHYWPMEEDGSAARVDIVGSLDLAASGSITRVTGKENYAVPQAQSGDCVEASDATPMVAGIVLSAWFKYHRDPIGAAAQCAFSVGAENGCIAIDTLTNEPELICSDAVAIVSPDAISDDSIHHAVGFIKDGLQWFAVDGEVVGSGDEPVTPEGIDAESAAIFVAPSLAGASGWVDEVAVWEGADFASVSDFARLASALYNAGDGIFFDGADWYEVV